MKRIFHSWFDPIQIAIAAFFMHVFSLFSTDRGLGHFQGYRERSLFSILVSSIGAVLSAAFQFFRDAASALYSNFLRLIASLGVLQHYNSVTKAKASQYTKTHGGGSGGILRASGLGGWSLRTSA